MLGKMMDTIARPSEGMSWPQLAACVVFISVVLIAWRQVVLYIAREM